ncbi:MAG: hypothetical protein M1835_007570 [Candelina submexicana]|nr:MAG: hypothetical protein M1835_007570 [Candelina submexicana]
MKVTTAFLPSLLLAGAGSIATAASSWGFEEATISIQGKGAGIGGGHKDKLSDNVPLSKPLTLGAVDNLKIVLTAVEDKNPRRPHQAFLTIADPTTNLETIYPLAVKESGKGKVELTQKDLPPQFLASTKPLRASLILGSFGSSRPFSSHVFNLALALDPSAPIALPEKPLRYGKQPEIHHNFKADPKSPPRVISLLFTLAILATLHILLSVWFSLGANINHLSTAMRTAPISHTLFFGSIVALEGIFFMYYTSWNLFQTMPAAAAVGGVAFLSGSRALSEVQQRRLEGLR